MGKNQFLVLFKDGQKKEIGSCSLVYLSEKEEVEMGSPLIEGFVKETAAMVHADFIEIQDSPTFCCSH